MATIVSARQCVTNRKRSASGNVTSLLSNGFAKTGVTSMETSAWRAVDGALARITLCCEDFSFGSVRNGTDTRACTFTS